MDRVAATDPPHGPPAAPETAAAAAAAPTGVQGSVPEGANNGANEAPRDDVNEGLTGADLVVVTAAQKKKERQARKAAKDALVEKTKRATALQHSKGVLRGSGTVYHVATESTPPKRKKCFDLEKPAVRVGAFVQVASALGIPGRARYGGKGYVVDVSGYGSATLATVEYTLGTGQRKESGIDIGRLTELESPLLTSPTRKRKPRDRLDPSPSTLPSSPKQETTSTVLSDILDKGYRLGKKKGWRRRELAVNGVNGTRMTPAEQVLLLNDYRELMATIRVEEKLGVFSRRHAKKRKVDGRFAKKSKSQRRVNPQTVAYLLEAWGLSRNYITKLSNRKRKTKVATAEEGVGVGARVGAPDGQAPAYEGPSKPTMITSMELAKKYLTPFNCFLNNERKRVRGENYESMNRAESAALDASAKAKWSDLGEQQKDVWKMRSRSMIAKQPYIVGHIVEALRADNTMTWGQLSSSIDDWCSSATIQRYVTSHTGTGAYCTYTERLLPLLSAKQRREHMAFSTHLRNLWGLGQGKYLWIHYDEKWFWGFVARMAKACPAMGVTRKALFAYHKNHINKVMAIAVVAFAFDGTPDNGGTAIKLAFTRAQASKIANKLQRAYSGTTADGRRQFQGPVVRRRGEAYSVDTTVTGSNEGTSDNPKFSLKRLCMDLVFELVEQYVQPGGQFEGYTPVFQGDQAGPHEEEAYKRAMTETCTAKGWLWEPQAPQMPHLNACDLALFPAMSKQHSELTRKHTQSVASKDVIWNAAKQVWADFPACKIARAFILAWRLANIVIAKGGANTFLGTKEMHARVREEFDDTLTGVAPK